MGNKFLLLAGLALVCSINGLADDTQGYIDELDRVYTKYLDFKKECAPSKGSGTAGAIAMDACMNISCTKLLGTIKEEYYMKLKTKHTQCSKSESSLCKEYQIKYKKALDIDLTCNKRIISR